MRADTPRIVKTPQPRGSRTIRRILLVALVLGAAGGGLMAGFRDRPISECDYLVLLKREALRCSNDVLAYEGAETRLHCAARRALRVVRSRHLDPPERSDTLDRLFATLDAQVHGGVIAPGAATRKLEAFVGTPGCLQARSRGPVKTSETHKAVQ